MEFSTREKHLIFAALLSEQSYWKKSIKKHNKSYKEKTLEEIKLLINKLKNHL